MGIFSKTPKDASAVELGTVQKVAPLSSPTNTDPDMILTKGVARRRRLFLDKFDDAEEEIKKTGVWKTAFFLVHTMIGSGILSQPKVFADAGIGATTFLYIVALLLMWLGGVLLIKTGEYLKLVGAKLDYNAVAYITHGRIGGVTADVNMALLNFSAVLSYVLLIGSMTSSLMQRWTDSEAWYTQEYFTCPIMVLIFIFPPTLVKHMTEIYWLAYVGLGSVLIVMALTFREAGVGPPASVADESLKWWDTEMLFKKSGSVIFSLMFGCAALHAYAGLLPRSVPAWSKSTAIALITGGVMCYTTGIVGYWTFRSETEGNIIYNFTGWAKTFSEVLLVVHLCFYTPLEFVIMRHSIVQLVGKEPLKLSRVVVVLLSAVLLALLVGFVLLLDLTGMSDGDAYALILDVSGSILGSMVSFILPGFLYYRVQSKGAWSILAIITALAGIGIAISGTITISMDVYG